MLEQRKALIEERKRAAAKTRVQKESITKVMEEVRTNATMANKIITHALTGKITLESLTSPGKLKGTAGRSKSATGRGKRGHGASMSSASRSGERDLGGGGMGNRTVSADRMGLGRESKSAGLDAEFETQMEDPSNRRTYSLPSLPPENAPMPYKSPYENSGRAQ